MKQSKLIGFVILMLCFSCESVYAAMASCSAQNKSSGQSFTSSGNGETQVAASREALKTAIEICRQSSKNPDECEGRGCVSG